MATISLLSQELVVDICSMLKPCSVVRLASANGRCREEVADSAYEASFVVDIRKFSKIIKDWSMLIENRPGFHAGDAWDEFEDPLREMQQSLSLGRAMSFLFNGYRIPHFGFMSSHSRDMSSLNARRHPRTCTAIRNALKAALLQACTTWWFPLRWWPIGVLGEVFHRQGDAEVISLVSGILTSTPPLQCGIGFHQDGVFCGGCQYVKFVYGYATATLVCVAQSPVDVQIISLLHRMREYPSQIVRDEATNHLDYLGVQVPDDDESETESWCNLPCLQPDSEDSDEESSSEDYL